MDINYKLKIEQKIKKNSEKSNKNEENKTISNNIKKTKYKIISIISNKNSKIIFIINNKILLPIIILLLINFLSFSFEKKNIRKLIYTNEIILKINGNGTQQIINNNYNIDNSPKIYVNDVFQEGAIKQVTKLQYESSIIKIELSSLLTSCTAMFSGLNNILEVDLSNFDASQVEDMGDMFSGCQSLKNMKGMFFQCFKLIELDLSNLETSSVTNMDSLFFECKELSLINLNNFDTSSVTNMNQMFLGCYALKSLDLRNFNTVFELL